MVIINKNSAQLLFNRQIQLFNKYLTHKIIQKNNNSYSPDLNGKKYLVIMACHCDSELKLSTIKKNLRYFAFENCHKILVNTRDLQYNEAVNNICSRHNNTKYYEMENTSYYDFGKWIKALNNFVNYNDYDYIIFTNDSYIIHNSINHFLNLAAKHNVELYGYNDSTQVKYHYQSYLFILRKDAVPTFINRVSSPAIKINGQSDIINHFELNMVDWFGSRKSFLKIGKFGLEKGHNIFFTNDALYLPLKNSGLLPFTKIKRII